jgi:hypothetical protein
MAVCGAKPTPERPTDDACERRLLADPGPTTNFRSRPGAVTRRAVTVASAFGGSPDIRPSPTDFHRLVFDNASKEVPVRRLPIADTTAKHRIEAENLTVVAQSGFTTAKAAMIKALKTMSKASRRSVTTAPSLIRRNLLDWTPCKADSKRTRISLIVSHSWGTQPPDTDRNRPNTHVSRRAGAVNRRFQRESCLAPTAADVPRSGNKADVTSVASSPPINASTAATWQALIHT